MEQRLPRSHPSIRAQQDRTGCCGTMQLPEYYQDSDALEEELEQLRTSDSPIANDRLLSEERASLQEAFA